MGPRKGKEQCQQDTGQTVSMIPYSPRRGPILEDCHCSSAFFLGNHVRG